MWSSFSIAKLFWCPHSEESWKFLLEANAELPTLTWGWRESLLHNLYNVVAHTAGFSQVAKTSFPLGRMLRHLVGRKLPARWVPASLPSSFSHHFSAECREVIGKWSSINLCSDSTCSNSKAKERNFICLFIHLLCPPYFIRFEDDLAAA